MPLPRTAAEAAAPAPEKVRVVAPASGAPFNEVESVILRRRSVRNFRQTQVPEYLVKRVLECGRYAPSAGNNQSWKYAVVRDPALIEEMTAHTRRWARRLNRLVDPTSPGALTNRVVATGVNWLLSHVSTGRMHPTGLAGLAQLASGELGLWHGAPTVILLLVDPRGPGKPLLDVGIAGQNMVLAAHSMGLGTCWVSFSMFLPLKRKYRDLFGIHYPLQFATSIALGYPLGQPDGFVPRETHETAWYEPGGVQKMVY